MQKCENCLHKKDCIDGANFKNAEKCKRFKPDDKAVIKALESCVLYKQICPETCPMADVRQCQIALKKNAFDIIKRQQAEIERLKKIQQTQADRIIEERGRRYELMSEVSMQLKTAKSEAVKEFAERLKEKFRDLARIDYNGKPMFIVGDAFIDNLVKEMGCSDAE